MASCPWQKVMSFYLKLVNPIVTGFLSWGPAGGTTYGLMLVLPMVLRVCFAGSGMAALAPEPRGQPQSTSLWS